jgi:hypothetical protein
MYSFHEIWVVVEHLGIRVAILGSVGHARQVSVTENSEQ